MTSSKINSVFNFTLVLTIAFIIICLILSRPVEANTDPLSGYYPQLLKVEYLQWDSKTYTGKAILTTSNTGGFKYFLETNIDDMCVGDFYVAIMYDNNTPNNIEDDSIVKLHYCRPDLFN